MSMTCKTRYNALLRLNFDDLHPEEWTPSYGGSSTCMDFLLKREGTVIETKMTRRRLDQKGVIDELINDKEHYRHHPDCRNLVCLVYDSEHRLMNPDALEGDVSSDEPGLVTRVVVAPRSS
jgi:REase_DpnII-MboI